MSSTQTWGVPVASALCAALLMAGCASYSVDDRGEHVEVFLETLAVRRTSLPDEPLSMEQCIMLAMENNYDVRLADLDTRLAGLGKDVAFSAFLPQVTLGADWIKWDKPPPMTDRDYATGSLSVAMPLVMPSVWFMYASQSEREAQAEAVAHYVRQGICFETMVAYYDCMISDDEVKVMELQVKTARETAERVRGLAAEGLAREWEGRQADAQLLAREAELAASKRNYVNRKGTLLNLMGLPPDYSYETLKLSGDIGEPHDGDSDLGTLVLTALASHPELELADREMVIRENELRMAIADFLPTLAGFANATWTTSDSSRSANRSGGLGSVWNVFDGFANVSGYRTADVQSEKSGLAREQTFLRIMLDVLVARNSVDDACGNAGVLALVYDASRMKYEDYNARQRRGLIPLSESLDAEADMNLAQLNMLRSKYQERVAWAALKMSMGVLGVPGTAAADEADAAADVEAVDVVK